MKQLNLFDYNPNVLIEKQPILKMSEEVLKQWKNKILQHQQQVIIEPSSKPQQLALFDLNSFCNTFSQLVSFVSNPHFKASSSS